ncbi:unnamed protein product [Closterium sp. NIES-64]|nr:unnamed protein product [Closterium sp. NIES-64]
MLRALLKGGNSPVQHATSHHPFPPSSPDPFSSNSSQPRLHCLHFPFSTRLFHCLPFALFLPFLTTGGPVQHATSHHPFPLSSPLFLPSAPSTFHVSPFRPVLAIRDHREGGDSSADNCTIRQSPRSPRDIQILQREFSEADMDLIERSAFGIVTRPSQGSRCSIQ